MSDELITNDFRTVLSLEPLLAFWRETVAPQCPHMAEMFSVFEKKLLETPALRGEITDPTAAAEYTDILNPLMTVAFPWSTWESELTSAFKPFTHHAFYATPGYRKYLIDDAGLIAGRRKNVEDVQDHSRRVRAYALILKRLYGIGQDVDTPFVRIVTDAETGLERHFQMIPDFQFIQVGTVGKPRELTADMRRIVIDHINDPDVLATLLPPESFEFRGFTIVRAVDVTESEITSALERDLIDQESIFSTEGFGKLQSRLQTLFGVPDLEAGLAAVTGDGEKVLILNAGDKSDPDCKCLFTNSSHIPMDQLKNSVWLQAVEREEILRIPDLSLEPNLGIAEQDAVNHGVRSILIAPLVFGGEAIGTLSVKTRRPNDLKALDTAKMKNIAPLFSMALKRGLDDMNNEVQAVIKEKCTAVHPSVEWRFRKAALEHMERVRENKPSEMEPIVFRDVIPMFGQSDIRGSSEARVKSIQADLTEQLTLAGKIMSRAGESKAWPLLDEFSYRIDKRIADIKTGLSTEEESSVAAFLQREVEPAFAELGAIDPGVGRAIDTYQMAVDPERGVIYRKRKDFEESVSLLNERLSTYLDQQQAEIQQVYPHYFEKHQTDGIDYVIYLGASMHPEGKLNPFFQKNLALWQFMVTCGLAWHTRQVQSELKIPLDTCHLILVNNAPLSIRFRYDEKRFDVDGAYDVRHEIIKSRLDKALVRGSRERLTQPGRIAVVYFHPREGEEVQQHIDYLQSRGHLVEDLETLDLEDLPGVRGLKALRVGVNLKAETVPAGLAKLAG